MTGPVGYPEPSPVHRRSPNAKFLGLSLLNASLVKRIISVEKESDVLGLRTVDKKKRSADAQSEDVFGGYNYSDETDELFGGDNIYEEYPDIYPVDSFVNREGDSEDIRLIQLGVVAWGIGCGREGLPSVYSSVASARCWLDQVMSCYQPTPGTSDSGDREKEISSVSHLDAFQ